MKYGIDLTWNQLCEDPGALSLAKQYLPALEGMTRQFAGAARLSLRSIGKYAPQFFPAEQLHALDKALQEYGVGKGPTSSEKAKIEKYCAMQANRTVAKGTPVHYSAFYPGQVWLDTNGNRIETHGGALYHEDNAYYWYGENKEYTDGKNGIWTWGIRMYRSTDLYNWDDLGLIAEPVLDDPDHNLFPDKNVDRPHILYCSATGKYVMWIKISGAESCFTLLQADKLTGPYTTVRQNYCPGNSTVGDFDLVRDPASETAYLFLATSPNQVAGFRLSPDYLSAAEKVSTQYEELNPPFCREGIAVFEYSSRKYMITSGMTGYTPNQSDCAISDGWDAPFRSIGDPHVEDASMASFNSQISQIFRLPGTEKYIAIADRWMPDHLLDCKTADAVRRAVASRYQPELYQATAEEQQMFAARPDLDRCNTSRSTYVWLPVHFVDGKPQICWYDSWTLEDLS